jgi:predicted dehydrogenase
MLRIGLLGAARIAPSAVLEPAARRLDVNVAAVAAERPGKADLFASQYGIPKAYGGYEELLADPEIDLVYNALSPDRHADLSIMALEAGKHVLCEKPFAMNATEAKRMVDASQRHGRRLIEAFHDRHHPIFLYLEDLAASGRLGRISAMKAVFILSIPVKDGDFRRVAHRGGGVLMDFGCYPVHWCRSLMKQEPEVVAAQATVGDAGVDEDMLAQLVFPSNVAAHIEVRMSPGWERQVIFEVEAERGSVRLIDNLHPHRGHSIVERIDGGFREFTVAGGTTFDYQLEAVVAAIRDGTPMPTEGNDSIGNMAVIDEIYQKSGLGQWHRDRRSLAVSI